MVGFLHRRFSRKLMKHLCDLASAAVLAGSDTTANTITLALYHLLTQPKAYERLKAEIEGAGDRWNDVSVQAKMAYLNGVM
jgi:cytochrome P450